MLPLGFRHSPSASNSSVEVSSADPSGDDTCIESVDSSSEQEVSLPRLSASRIAVEPPDDGSRIRQPHGYGEQAGIGGRTSIAGSDFDSLSLSSSDADDESESSAGTAASSSCATHWAALGAMRGVAEYLWQGGGRMVNAGCFVALSHGDGESLRIAATALSAASAGYCSYRLIRSQLGSSTYASTLAAAAGGIVLGGAAGMATYLASTIPGATLAATGTLGFIVSGLFHHATANGQNPDDRSAVSVAVPPVLVVLGGAASIAVAVAVPALRSVDHGRLGRRTLALLAEAATVELLKGSTETAIPGIDKSRLPFERRLRAGLIGMLPYAVASVVFSGVLGNLLRAQMHSERFEDYLVPLLVGAVSNVIKGAINTALLHCGGACPPCSATHEAAVRPAEGLKAPQADKLLTKTALRFMLMHGRDVLFLALVDGGMDEMSASCVAYTLYAFFAQHRELMFDIMQGDGWSTPGLRVRNAGESR